ncbi:MAG: hypothetical protein ACK5ME_04705 [Parahaliea sp.]
MPNRMIIGVDLAKTSFVVVMLNGVGNELSRKTVKRQHLLPYFARQEVAVVAIEACAGAHHCCRPST